MDDERAADQMPEHNWANYKEDIIAEQVKQLYALLPFGVVATLLNSVIVFFILKNVMPHEMLFIWLAAIMIITMLRIAVAMRFQRTKFQPATARAWGNRFIAGLTLSGIVWGSIGIFPFSGVSLAHQVFIAFVLGGMAAGASATYSVSKQGYLAYSIPALVPLGVRFFLMNDIFHYAMGGMLCLYGLLLWRISWRHYLVNSTSLLLRFENRGMIDQLRNAKEDVEKLYNELLAETHAKLKAEAELRAHHDHLERVVEERTRELRQSEEQLLNSEATLRLAIESTGLGIVDFHPVTGELIWSDLAKLHFGLPPGTHVDYNIFVSGIHPEDRDRVNDIVQKVLRVESGGTYSTEYRTIGIQDRKERRLAAHGQVFFNESGEPVRLIGTTMDITERKTVEEELLKTRKLESVAILSKGIAHDFNNMLTSVLGFISLSKELVSPTDQAHEYLTVAESACVKAKELTHQLDEFASGVKLERKTSSLVPLLQDSSGLLSKNVNVKVNISIPDNLWSAEIDERQISQVMHELVKNASEAMPNGGVIDIVAKNTVISSQDLLPLQEGHYIKISVKDRGVGMVKENLSNIFEPYFTTKQLDYRSGIGLGLALCYSIVKGHKGYIVVESELGKGTVVHVYLPGSPDKNEQIDHLPIRSSST